MAIRPGFGITNIVNGGTLDNFLPEANKNTENQSTDRGWLPAPYNVITEPVDAGNNTTNYGNNYAASKKAFDERVARIDQTEEAANLRQAWATPPRVGIENGRLKLTGSSQFLASDTANQLRSIFKEMEGQTYNTEALNQQIEAWNVDLQKMAEDNMKNLDTLNEMNYSISQTATGPNPHMLTYADLLRIGNNVAVGKQEDALNSDKLIFVGYEWDDEGNQIPKYMTAKEFAEEFNSTPDPGKPAHNLREVWDNAWSNLPEKWENRNADALISGKRRAWSQLNAQAKEGDPGAIAKLMYLQGGSEGGPANVVMSGAERFNDFVFITSINAMNGLTAGLDFATEWYNAPFGNILGLPRLIGNINNVAENGGDWSKFWESDTVDKQVEEMNDAVSWANSYFSAVTPGSTMLGATLGGIEGMVASIAYNVVSANIGQELGAQVVNKGLTAAGNALELSGHGVRISATIESTAGKLQGVTSMSGSMVTGTGYTIANATKGTAELSIVLPRFLVEGKLQGLGRLITEVAFSIQAASQGVQLAGMAGSDIGVFVSNTNPAFQSLFNNGTQSLALIPQGAKTAGNVFIRGKQTLDSMRNLSTGLRLGFNLYMAGNYHAIRHIDRYLRDQYNGKDDGDMASYVALNTARDVAIAAALGIGGATFNHFRQISRMSKMAPTRVVDAAQIGTANSANGFYTSSASAQATAQTKAEPAQETYTEMTKLFNSSMTANGERFFVPNDAAQATVVPGSSSVAGPQGVATATGIIKDNKLIRSRIVPAVGGFNVVSSIRDLATGEETTDISFHLDFDSANNELQKSTVPIVNPKTLGNSDLAVSANVAPLSVDGLSAIRHLPDGTSRLRISNDVLYLKPEEFEQKVSDIVAQMTPETAVEFTNSVRSIDLDSLAARIYGEGPELPAPQLRVPKNAEEAKAFARDVATARAVSQYNGDRGVVIPTKIDADTVDIVRRRRMTTDRVFYAQQPTEFQAPEDDIADFTYATGSSRRNDWQGTEHGAMLYATGGIPTEVDTYPSSRAEKSIQSITGKNYNTPSLLRSKVGKDSYDLGESLFSLEILRNIANGGAVNWYVGTTGIKTATTAKNFIANVYGGEKFYRNGIVVPLKGEYLYDLSYHIFGEQLDDPYFKLNDVDNQYLRMLDENPGATREGSLYEYYRDYKGKQVSVVKMHPDDYFKILKKETGLTEAHIDEMRGSTKYYDELFASGGKADVPYLLFDGDSTGKYNGQEGRHRILAAQKKGAQYVPVIIVHPAGTPVTDFIGPAIGDTGHYYADWTNDVQRYVTTYSEYGKPEIVAKEEIDKIYAEVDEAVSAHERAYGDKVPRDGINALKDIVRKNEDKVISSIIRPNQEAMNGLFDKISTKAMQNLAKGLEVAISKQGTKAITDFRAPGFFDNKTGIVHILSNNFDPLVDMEGSMTVHVPKGTKLLSSNFPAITDFGTWVDDYKHYVVGIEKGYRITDDGLFINTPKGEPHYPKIIEFTPGSAAIYSYPDEAFDSEVENYQQFAKDFLKPLHSKEELRDIYKVLLPGGRVNETNAQLRTARSFGKIPETTLTTFITDIIANINNSYVNGFGDDAGKIPVIRVVATIEQKLQMLSEDFPELYNAFSSDDSPVMSTFIKILKPLKQRVEAEEENGILYFPGGFMTDEELNKIKMDLMEVAINETDNLPKGLTRQMKAIQKMEGDASHESLAPWVGERGMAVGGNMVIKDSSDFAMDLDSLEVGDDYVDPGFAFITLNPAVPTYYTSGGKNSGNKYIIRYIGQEGTKVYHFGDTKNFTDRVHVADGGAMIIPRNAHGKIVSKMPANFNGEKVTILYVVLDGKDGAYNGPIDNADSSIEMVKTKKRKTVDVEVRTPRKYVVTENGLTKESFSDVQEALDYKAQGDRQIYELDSDTPVMDRPPVTTDSLYNPAVRSESATGKMPEDTTYEAPKFDASGHIERFNDLMVSMPLLRESPTDYTQGIVDIAREVQAVYNGIAETVDMPALYEDYARQIAEGVEQPTVSPELREALAPLSSMLSALGHYFDPSGSSLTQDFYLPTGAPSKKLASVEDALLHPDRAVDVDNPAAVTFDEILVDPMRIGDSGFWEKRSGELFRDEDGNFTMAKAGTLEENLIAYTVAALTRGQNALLVAANDEVAFAKSDRNRNPISTTEALKGLKGADKNRQKIRAAQIKNARGYGKKLKDEKINKLEDNYDDKSVIDAIEETYAEKDFAKDIDYTRNVAENSRILGYRRTLTINNLKGSALRFGSNNGFRGIANDIRRASHIKVTGTKWVTRYGEKRCVAFGLTDAQMAETEATVSEPAVNLGDSAMMLFAPDRAAGAFYRTILDQSEQWATEGGMELLNSIKDFARQNFPLLSNPERAAEKLFQKLTRNFDAYNDPTALYLANQETISAWIKSTAAQNINSAIQMADVDAMDDRTIDAIDQIMTKALVGSAVYNSKIVSALQRATYAATLWFNPSPMVGNLLSEPARGIDFFGYKVFAKAMKQFISPKARAIAKTELGDLDSYLNNDPELVGLAAQVKSKLARAFDSFENKAMSPLQKSEEQKNLLFWMMAKENAKLMYPKDPSAQLQNALRTFNDVAIAGGPGTTPGVASSNLGRMAFILKTFSLRNWDDFIEMTEQIGYGRSGSYKWDRTRRGQDTGGQGGYSSTAGGRKFNYKKAGRFLGGTLLRRYLLWLFVLGPLGRSIWDALGGDPTGLTENYSRGLYDDEGTDEYEGMTPLDNIINHIPTGFIFGTLKDFYFAARRAGVETGDFLGPIDIERDARLQKDLKQHLPLGVMTRRVGDMLELMDRGYSYNSNGNKTYAAPQTLHDVLLGFTLGKNATSNAQAYNKYRYGAVNIWGDIFEGDWLDFAMSANPLAGDLNMAKFDTTRTDYNGVFHGSYNDVPVMQAAVADLRERRATIIREYNEDLEKFTGEFEGLTDEQKKAKAAERREAKIQAFTEDVQRLVDEYQKAGNALSDKQINTLMYLFDFNEGDDDTYDSQIARERYVQAELPDVSTNIVPKQDKDTGEVTEPNYFQRSLVYQNAVQGRYGIPREAAKAVDSALADFKNVYKEYKKRVSELNDKAYSAAKGSADRKKYQAEVEKVQEEYLNQLYTALTPVVQQYGTEVLSSNDVIESLQPYMSSMVPYSSIKKYGLQYNNGNDIVWGQLSDWVKNRWGATAPTAGSDPEITNGIKEIKSLKDQGKISQAKSQARLLLERIARGSLSARNNDVIELRSLLYD